jgi:hypothetical protein
MKLILFSLRLGLKGGEEAIFFSPLSYFWGQMGAGKTSIARLIDYCLGGNIELTPALQNEFVTATLTLELANTTLSIERPRDAESVIASWTLDGEPFQVSIPARKADGEVIPGSGVEHLSDLIFWLSGIAPPRVRRSKQRADTGTERLSLRDLLWYCYLDQDELDSSFFNLDEHAYFPKRLKSRDVLRLIVGFHDEHIAELEASLDMLRGERQALGAVTNGMTRALKEMDVESETEIEARVNALKERAGRLQGQIDEARTGARSEQTKHATDELRNRALRLAEEVFRIDDACRDIKQLQDRDRRHLSEIETLSLKFKRSLSAKAVLSGVEFDSCPRCTQQLPDRVSGHCHVCGLTDVDQSVDPLSAALVERDISSRTAELYEIIKRRAEEEERLKRRRGVLATQRDHIERERNELLVQYDSAYLSGIVANERERSAVLQEAETLASLVRLPRMLAAERKRLATVQTSETALRMELAAARQSAEADTVVLETLNGYFLDCLLRSGIPGITRDDHVEIRHKDFYPVVHGPDPADTTITSFGTISSGGKKTLFKCCFAVAVHRLAVALGATLPSLLIIDSPMKNISERENREQFVGFYLMLYELKATELAGTQIILFDKEYAPPPANLKLAHVSRHMRPGDPENPPLIPYYKGK